MSALNIFATTFNAQLRANRATVKDLSAWLKPRLLEYRAADGSERKQPPDLCVIAMQEVGELHLALTGLIAPLLSLLTLQMTSILSSHASSISPSSLKEHYTLLGLSSHANTVLWVFALDRTLPLSLASNPVSGATPMGQIPANGVKGEKGTMGEKGRVVGRMESTSVGLGFMGGLLGNKGAVAGRFWVERPVQGDEGGTVLESFSMISTHFAPHPENISQRIANYARLTSYILLPSHPPSLAPHATEPPKYTQISDSDHTFLMGDINYRLGSNAATGVEEKVPEREKLVARIMEIANRQGEDVAEGGEEGDGSGWEEIVKWDTLLRVQAEGKTLGGFNEAKIDFAPSYKKIVGKVGQYSTKRTPAYTDRILFSSSSPTPLSASVYTSVSSVTLSDHSPVVLTLSIPSVSSSVRPVTRASTPQVYPPASDLQILAESWLSWGLDRTVGYAWLGLLLIGAGRGVGVGVAVLVAILALGWYLA